MKPQEYVEKALDWAQRKGFTNIRANIDDADMDAPISFSRGEEKKDFIPDLTGLKTGGKSYIEVSTKTDNERRTVTKWKLLSTLASMKGGRLFLLAPHGHKAFTQRIVNRYGIEAKVVSI